MSATRTRTQPSAPNNLGEPDAVVGGGEMGNLIRAMDWSKTALGPIETWPQSLRSALSILLPSKAQIALFWGESLITLYNDAYRPVFGAKHPGALGKPIREAWDELWRDGLKEIFDGVLTNGEAFWAQDRPFFMERYGYLEETFFDVSYDPVRDESGRVGGVFCIVSETTRRVIGERRLRALRDLGYIAQNARTVADVYPAAVEVLARYAEDLPFVLLYTPEDAGRLRLSARVGLAEDSHAAPPALSVTGESPWPLADELVTLSAAELERFGPLYAGPWPEAIGQVVVLPVAAGHASHTYLIAGVSPRRALDGDYLDFLRLVAGNIAGALASVRKAEDEHKRAELLAELDRAKTAFFSNVSHEFRTPLTLMLGPLSDLLTRPPAETLAEHADSIAMIYRNGQRLLKLVNMLLDFARLEAGRIQAVYEPTDLGAATRDLASTFRSACERAGLDLVVQCPSPSEPAYVDRQMWERIVLNLLSNAFKFTIEGRIVVALQALPDRFELTVADSGTGIPPEALPRLFERFFRIEGARGRSHEGSGIGLALVQELVKLHGGSISVESTCGEGTVVTVSLPKGYEHLAHEQLKDTSSGEALADRDASYVSEALSWMPDASERSAAMQPSGRARVLFADDNADLREYASRLLADYYEVEAVSNGEAALEAARRDKPDLIVSDVMMPGLDGFELIRALRADPDLRSIPILMLSARAGEEARMEGIAQGADDYIVKPFGARELLVRVGSLLQTAEFRRQSGEQLRVSEERTREQLEELEALLEALPVGVFIARDRACTNIVTNEAGSAMLRIPRGANASKSGPRAQSLPFRIMKDGVEMTPSDLPMQRAARLGKPVAGEEVELVFADGTALTLYEYATPLFDAKGEVRGCIGLFVDLTDRKQIERALRRSEEQLREADRRKDEFLAMLAHELRNPLAPIMNALQLMRRDTSADPIQRQARAIVDRQAARLTRLVDDLLEVARITSGRIQLHRELVAVAGIVERAVETVRPLIEQHRHTLTISLPSEPLMIRADPTRMEQVLVNLLNNAAKYTDDGGSIELTGSIEGESVALTVRDTGIGIDAELLPRVFDLFTQAERSLDRASGGLGIGLSLVRQLVLMHGGTTEVNSAPGQGTAFTVKLPLSKGMHEDFPHRDVSSSAPASAGSLKVLVIDDNVDAANSLAMLLETSGHTVRTIYDGRTASAEAAQYRPDVVFLDIGLPYLDGYEVAAQLRAASDSNPPLLIAVTGYGQEADRERSRAAGFDAHLTKPAEFARIEALLARHTSERALNKR